MKNFRIFSKIFLVFLSLLFVSCAPQDDQPRIRIVDLQGNAKPVTTRMPELNAQAISAQGGVVDRRGFNQDKIAPSPRHSVAKREDFGSSSVQSIQQTLQSPQAQEVVQNIPSDNSPALVAGTPEEDRSEAVEYVLSDPTAKEKEASVEKSVSKKPAKKIIAKKSHKEVVVAKAEGGKKKFFVQVGSFTNQGNAELELDKMKKFHSGKVEIVEGEKTIYRVWVGPFSDRQKANAMVKKISAAGHSAILVRGK